MPRHHQLTAERISTPTSQHNTTPSSAGVGAGPTPRQRAKQVRDSTKIHPSHLQEKAAPGMPGSNLPPLPAAMQHHAPPHAPAGPMPGLINPSMAQAIPGLQAQYMEMARRFLMQQEQQDKITKDQVCNCLKAVNFQPNFISCTEAQIEVYLMFCRSPKKF